MMLYRIVAARTTARFQSVPSVLHVDLCAFHSRRGREDQCSRLFFLQPPLRVRASYRFSSSSPGTKVSIPLDSSLSSRIYSQLAQSRFNRFLLFSLIFLTSTLALAMYHFVFAIAPVPPRPRVSTASEKRKKEVAEGEVKQTRSSASNRSSAQSPPPVSDWTPSSDYPSSSTSSQSQSNVLPEFVPYLLIGAGTASYYASLAIRARDPDAKVLIVGAEQESPYNRPALSKDLWWYGDADAGTTMQYRKGTRRKSVHYEAGGFYLAPGDLDSAMHGGVALLHSHRVARLEPDEHVATLDDGRRVRYGKALIATGTPHCVLPDHPASFQADHRALCLSLKSVMKS